jgi:hypothetical protein
MSWGRCTEAPIPDECVEVESWFSPDFEVCLLESGFCVQDMWDLDNDGDAQESLGSCD